MALNWNRTLIKPDVVKDLGEGEAYSGHMDGIGDPHSTTPGDGRFFVTPVKDRFDNFQYLGSVALILLISSYVHSNWIAPRRLLIPSCLIAGIIAAFIYNVPIHYLDSDSEVNRPVLMSRRPPT